MTLCPAPGLRADLAKRSRVGKALARLILAALLVSAAWGAEESRHFNIPEGNAKETLRKAAKQAEAPILFSAKIVKGVRTPSIKGRLSLREALDRMLEDTPLAAVQDRKTEAYAVIRRDSGRGASLGRTQISISKTPHLNSQTQMKKQEEKSESRLKAALRALTSAVLATGAISADAQEEENDDDIFELSPFVLDAEEDEGYRATTTLAGTRIRSDLKDLGASISVLTDGFMDDLAGTDGENLLTYVGNVEVGGPTGNFANADLSAFSTEESRVNPQRGQRIRGLSEASTQRDFFHTDIPFDSYNTSRVDINRGPNSVLFGIGSPGGVINSSTNRAILEKDFGEVSFRFDGRGGHRQTLDYNKTLLDNRLAFRVAAMNEKLQFNQEPAFEDDARWHVTGTWVPFLNEESNIFGRTTLRASFERGEIDRNPPDVVVPIDSFSVWWEGVGGQERLNSILKVPGVDLDDVTGGLASFGTKFNVIAATREQARNAINAGLVNVPGGQTVDEFLDARNFFKPQVTIDRFEATDRDDDGGGADMTIADTPFFAFPAVNFSSPNAAEPGFADPALKGVDGIMGRFRPAGFISQDVLWSFNPFEEGPLRALGFEQPSISNEHRDVFDAAETLFQGRTNSVRTDIENEQIFFSQEFFDGKAGFEFAFDRQEKHTVSFLPLSGLESKTINIDLMRYHGPGDENLDGIADRLPNENLGRPVVPSVEADNATESERRKQETFRYTVFGELDFEDVIGGELGGWLGTHSLTGLYEYRENTIRTEENRHVWWSDFDPMPTDSNIMGGLNNSFLRRARTVVNVGPSALNVSGPGDLRLDPSFSEAGINIDFPDGGDSFGVWIWDNEAQTSRKAVWEVIETIQDADRRKTELESWAAMLQSSFLNDHIVTMVAYRQDDQEAFERLRSNANFGDPSQPGVVPERIDLPGDNRIDGNFNLALLDEFESEPISTTNGSTFTFSIVGRFPEDLLFELPFGIDVQAHYFDSESFLPGGFDVNVLNEPLGAPSGETEEYGGTVSFFNNRFSLRVNKYETILANQRTGNFNGQLGRIPGNPGLLLGRLVEGYNAGIPLEVSEEEKDLPPSQRTTGTDADLAGAESFQEMFDTIISLIPPEIQEVANWRVERMENGQLLEMRDPIPGTLNSTQDLVTEGIEVELVGNLTKNITTSINASKQQTVLSNIGPTAIPLAFEFWNNLNTPLPNSPVGLSYAELRLNTGLSNPALSGTEFAEVIREMQVQQGKDGQNSQEQRKWRVNAVFRYSFLEGMFDGLTLGTAFRWQQSVAGGFRNRLNEDGLSLPDISDPIFGPDEFFGDFFANYERKLNNKINWKIQFNAKNLYRSEGDDFIPVSFNPDGSVAVSRIGPERQFFVTNTFSF